MQLEAFLGHWRQFLQPQHSLVFSQLNGAPMTMQAVYKIFHTSAFRVSGKKTNPHLVRDMVVTYLRSGYLHNRTVIRAILAMCAADVSVMSQSMRTLVRSTCLLSTRALERTELSIRHGLEGHLTSEHNRASCGQMPWRRLLRHRRFLEVFIDKT